MFETINRGYVYHATPVNEEVKNYFLQCFGADRTMYNAHVRKLYDFLEQSKYQVGNKLPAFKKLGIPTISELKKKFTDDNGVAYFYEVDAFACNEAKQHFKKACSAFNKIAFKKQFKKSALKRKNTLGIEPTFRDLKGMPKFHSRKNSKQSYTTFNQGGNIYLENNVLYVPTAQKSKLKNIGLKLTTHRPLPENARIKNVTVSMNNRGKFTVSINVEFEREIPNIGLPSKVLGLDYSQSNFFVDNEGKKANYPGYYRKMMERLALEQRSLSRKKKGSKRWEKQCLVVSKLHEKTTNQRKDWLHKKSYQLAKKYDVIVVEDLDLRVIAQNPDYSKNLHDNGFGYFRLFLKYKLGQQGKYFVKADKYFASTQICSCCGFQNEELKGNVTIREWDCPNCLEHHARDINSGRNLYNYGIEQIEKEIKPQLLVVA
jgi:putative transposase